MKTIMRIETLAERITRTELEYEAESIRLAHERHNQVRAIVCRIFAQAAACRERSALNITLSLSSMKRRHEKAPTSAHQRLAQPYRSPGLPSPVLAHRSF